MNERMTRKELTAKVKDLAERISMLQFDAHWAKAKGKNVDKKISDISEFITLIYGHLGVIATETEAVPSKLVLKKVRKPYTRKK